MTEQGNHQKETNIVEVCCGSLYDARQAALGGADRIELNSALALGGLTPTAATLRLIKAQLPDLPVMAMVRPRGAGFCYLEEDFFWIFTGCCFFRGRGDKRVGNAYKRRRKNGSISPCL